MFLSGNRRPLSAFADFVRRLSHSRTQRRRTMAAAADLAGGGSPPLRHLLDAANTTTAQLPLGGPYSPILDVLFCLAPIAFLLVVTLSQRLFM